MFASPSPATVWGLITRLGEAQILLPAMLVVCLWLMQAGAGRLARTWAGCTALAAALTTLSKVAFLGWGIGWAALDFTGISGHAMFAAAILPVLMRCIAAPAPRPWQQAAALLGVVLALVIAASRVRTGAHSVSEVVIGLAVGAAASLATVVRVPLPPTLPAPRALAVGLVLWLLVGPVGSPPSVTHGLVTRLALALSGQERPYTRARTLRQHREPPAAPVPGATPAARAGTYLPLT
jgi:membrane-associated phospholipid phosphatase